MVQETAHAKAKALTEAKRAAARAGLSGGGGDSWGLKVRHAAACCGRELRRCGSSARL